MHSQLTQLILMEPILSNYMSDIGIQSNILSRLKMDVFYVMSKHRFTRLCVYCTDS